MTTDIRTIRPPRGPALSRATRRDAAMTSLDNALDKIGAKQRTRDVLNGGIPYGMSLADADVLRVRHPKVNLERTGIENAFDIRALVPEYVRPLFCERKASFRWAALPGDPDDIRVIDEAALEMFADNAPPCCGIRTARA